MNLKDGEDGHTPDDLTDFPLSRGQRALWFHYQVAPESVAYHLAGAVTVPEDTNLETLRRAFQKLVARHAMLRARFSSKHGEGIQRVYPSIEVAFQAEDASGWNADQLDQQLEKEIDRPFDLEQGPTWRVVVFKQALVSKESDASEYTRAHLILLVLHHIIGDLWSTTILLSETAALYQEEMTGSIPAQRKTIRASYADHMQYESNRLAVPQAEES